MNALALLSAALLAFSAPTCGDGLYTLDVVSHGRVYSFTGTHVATDSLGGVGSLVFVATSLTVLSPPGRTLSDGRMQPAGDWDIVVNFQGKFIGAEHCRQAFEVYRGGSTHRRYVCTGFAP